MKEIIGKETTFVYLRELNTEGNIIQDKKFITDK